MENVFTKMQIGQDVSGVIEICQHEHALINLVKLSEKVSPLAGEGGGSCGIIYILETPDLAWKNNK